MASVTLSRLGLTYPDGTVGLDAVDLTVADGEFIALVGPSGSGKTTLLRAIAGFLAPTTGTVHIGDTLVAGPGTLLAPEKRGLGMVFQQHAVWPHLTVAQNIVYPLRRAGVGRAQRAQQLARVLSTVGLTGFDKRNPATLSGGQRQRVALARAIIGSPRVLLLDEALSALDEPLRGALRLELQALTRSIGLTVIHVTHDREEALALADRVVVLDGGRVQQIGAPPELVSLPNSPAVARFLSDATIFSGVLSPSGFVATDHPCAVPGSRIEAVGGRSGPGSIAVLPEDIDLVAASADRQDVRGEGDDDHGSARVTSSLFGRTGNDVVVDWEGASVRCRVPGVRPLVGEPVRVSVRRAVFYPRAAAPAPAAVFAAPYHSTEIGG
ncbi:ABC transporter ATP-binding protein [Cryobacterium melibiosiphilum]|uniref:ABC-type quaternary amine transporter n=1 Tax=Cryobacterium melibiosiphilum TaxID=995039 RepID=A0A3A5MGU7_9MICO|nr:ABC transporter ATP-binding protein [Cryobacterium melibiosiphilum]RJT88642.1 ABC transporter ATP-binding protein [Cryobacterium melibiosiphilum]RJT89404.1 ABC transporter ATP-binding protein [Cryobacterium melibiosiphilum]